MARHTASTTPGPRQWQTGAPHPTGSCLCSHSYAGATPATAIAAAAQHRRAVLLGSSNSETRGLDGIHADTQDDHRQHRRQPTQHQHELPAQSGESSVVTSQIFQAMQLACAGTPYFSFLRIKYCCITMSSTVRVLIQIPLTAP